MKNSTQTSETFQLEEICLQLHFSRKQLISSQGMSLLKWKQTICKWNVNHLPASLWGWEVENMLPLCGEGLILGENLVEN